MDVVEEDVKLVGVRVVWSDVEAVGSLRPPLKRTAEKRGRN